MNIIDCTGLFVSGVEEERGWELTRITGQRSRAEMYAKEVLSDVDERAEELAEVIMINGKTYGSWYRTPFLLVGITIS